jgi:hypothetical protein
MLVAYFITKEIKEKAWLESGRVINQANSVEIDPMLMTPEARQALGFQPQVQIPLEDALPVDPEHRDIVIGKVVDWLNKSPARKERQNILYRLADLTKKIRSQEQAINQRKYLANRLESERNDIQEGFKARLTILKAEMDEIKERQIESDLKFDSEAKRHKAEIPVLESELENTKKLAAELHARFEVLK